MTVVVLAVLWTCSQIARASEFGVSTYRPGLFDLFAGYLAPPGTTIIKNYFLFQDAGAKAITANGIVVKSHTITYTVATFAGHVTSLPVLGSHWAFGGIAMFRIADQSIRVRPRGGPMMGQTSTVGGLGDIILAPCLLNWDFGQFHLMAGLTFYAPTGSYDRQRIIDIGTNRWAVEPDAGLTWMSEGSGREASVFAGYTVNTENTATHYLSGNEFHVDFVLAQHLLNGMVFGVTGYALQQTTPDSGRGAVFGPFRGRVIALGPLIGKTFEMGRIPVSFKIKYDVEFEAQNRSSGNELWITAAFRF
jgi:hypothetical protein